MNEEIQHQVFSIGDFLGGWGTFFKMVNIFTHTCSNRSGVGAIDSPDRFEHVLRPYCTQEVLGKNFRHEISIVRPQKLAKNALFCCF